MENNTERAAPFTIRAAAAADVADILRLIRALAEYEKLSDEVIATESDLYAALFGDDPVAKARVAMIDGDCVGFALYFRNFSTFRGRPGLYLEDLFVEPEQRGKGIGLAILRSLAQEALALGYARVEWSVLDWNTPSIGFYKSLGAKPMDEWTIFRLTGDALQDFAK